MSETSADAKAALLALDQETSATLLAAASDITLFMGLDGVLTNASGGSGVWESLSFSSWVGRPWVETVSTESRPKIEEMLRDLRAGARSTRFRHINQIGSDGAEVPVLFSLVTTSKPGQVIAIGRDLRNLASLQSRLLEAQQIMDRDYQHLRRVENQYRTLFGLVKDPVLLVETENLSIIESNRAAAAFFEQSADALNARSLEELVSAQSLGSLRFTLKQVDGSGRPSEVLLSFPRHENPVSVLVSCIRQDGHTAFILRIDHGLASHPLNQESSVLLDAIQSFSDGVVITDTKGLITQVNPAFVDMTQSAHSGQLIGESMSMWLGRANTDLLVLLNSLTQSGSVRLFATQLRAQSGVVVPVEISGVVIGTDDTRHCAFVVRDVGRRLGGEPRGAQVSRTGEDLAALVGRMPLKEIVGETVDLIERLCIETALKMTRNNRASAADMLGVSRQSLYVKLRRFGLQDFGDDPDSDTDDA